MIFAVAAVAAVALRFAWTQMVLARTEAAGGGAGALLFLLASLALCTGPGLLLWRTARLSSDSPSLFLVHVLATSLGCAMLAPWLLLLCGLWTRIAALALVLAAATAGLAAATAYFATAPARAAMRRGIVSAAQSLSWSEALAIAFSFAIGELLFELVAGTPMQGWDAFLSWDRWAEEFAAGHSLGRGSFGFYPPGIPLLGSIFYKILPATGPVPASAAHLLLHGFHAVFPLLLLLSICALSRPFGFNPLAGQLLVLSDFFLVQSLLKQAGDADVPLAALSAAAISLVFLAAVPSRKGAPRFAVLAAVAPAFFAILLTKGSGVALLPAIALALRGAAADRATRRKALLAFAVATALAAPFFLHQCALALFPSLAVHDPLKHFALPLETAHVSLFTPNLPHLLGWVRKAGPLLGLGGGDAVSFAVAALFALAVLAALFDRKARASAAGAILLFAIWFFTASYDWRNAFSAHLLACLAAAAMLQRLVALPRRPAARAALEGALLLACILLFSRQRLPALARRLVQRPARPAPLAIREEDRPAVLSDLGDRFALLRAVPFLRDAPHLLLPGRDFRLVPNGVRGLPYRGADTFASPCHGDLAFARRAFFAPTSDYRPVARLAAPRPFGESISLYRPVPRQIPFRTASGGQGVVLLTAETGTRSGFLEVRFSKPLSPGLSARAEGRAREAPSADLAASFDALCLPWIEGAILRIPFWIPEGDAERPTFRIVSDHPVQILSVHLLE